MKKFKWIRLAISSWTANDDCAGKHIRIKAMWLIGKKNGWRIALIVPGKQDNGHA